MTKYILIIWEMIPEATHLYLIPESATEDHILKLKLAHLNYINANDMNAGLEFLNEAFSEEPSEEDSSEYHGIWAKYKTIMECPIRMKPDEAVVEIYHSGFVL